MKTSLFLTGLVILITSLTYSQTPISIQASVGLSQPISQNQPHNRDLGFCTTAMLFYGFSQHFDFGILVSYSVFRDHYSGGVAPASGIAGNPSKDNIAAQIGAGVHYRPWSTDWPGTYLLATLGVVRNEIPGNVDLTSFEPKVDRSFGLTYSVGIGKEIEITRHFSIAIEGLYRQNSVQVYEYHRIRERVHLTLSEVTLNSGLRYSF